MRKAKRVYKDSLCKSRRRSVPNMRHSSKGERGHGDRGLLNEEKTSFNSLFLKKICCKMELNS